MRPQPQDPWENIHERDKRDYVFKVLESKEELVEWVLTYFDIDFTTEITDEASNSNPADAMWQIYEAVRDNRGDEIPGFILLSSRDSYKTLCASILELLLLLHFKVTIAHMAAIQSQSSKAIRYISVCINKIKKYIEYHGWKNISSSKSMIQFKTPEGDEPYITVIICTMTGANSEHTNLMFVDEIDVVRDPLAYEESKMIPGVERGRFPITVKLSTRKFAFGLMQKEIEGVKETGEVLLNWNLLDVTERCPSTRHSPSAKEGAKKFKQTDRYIARDLPLRQISPEEYEALQDIEKPEWESAKAYEGCLKCKLFAVCKGKLANKKPEATGGLYKPIQHTINQFRKVNPDTAQAQLLCRKPSSKGLIYGRIELDEKLSKAVERRNVITIEEAYEQLMGDLPRKKLTIEDLREVILQLGIKTYAGGDWGYAKEFALVVGAVIPNGDFWILETFSMPDLELSDQVDYAKKLKERWNIRQFFMDTAYPGSIKTFESNGLKCPKFTKDVMGGIEAIRGQIVDANNRRNLKVVLWKENEKFKQMLKVHHFKLDAAGNVTEEPDDDVYSDIGDGTRYMGQNLFGKKKGPKPIITSTAAAVRDPSKTVSDAHRLQEEIRRRTHFQEQQPETPKAGRKGKKIFWSF